MSDPLQEQYATGEKLRTRMSLHKRFRVGDVTWPRWMFDRMSLPSGGTILELGCGTGLLWRVNADRVSPTWRLILTDFSDGMVREARRATAGLLCPVRTAVIDAQAIPFADASVGAVVAGHMLYHVPDRERAIGEVRRVLEPDGVFYASTIGRRYLEQAWELLAAAAPDAPQLFEYAHAAFGEESAPDLLGRAFARVDVEVFEESLRVTEAEAVADYLRSVLESAVLSPAHLEALTAAVRSQIEAHGALDLDAPAVLFTCRG